MLNFRKLPRGILFGVVSRGRRPSHGGLPHVRLYISSRLWVSHYNITEKQATQLSMPRLSLHFVVKHPNGLFSLISWKTSDPWTYSYQHSSVPPSTPTAGCDVLST